MNDNSAHIIRCPECQAANRIPANRLGVAAKCGKCHTELPTDAAAAEPEVSYKMRCTGCGAKNRVPGGKLKAGAKCGKCGSQLKTEELFTPQPIMINDGNFEDMVLKSPLPVMMWAWAPW
jgi:thioredoxin 2